MQHRRLFVCALLLLVPAGCKPANSLAVASAQAQLQTALFAAPGDIQTLTFVSGGARAPKPLPFEGFLYAKHWLACEATEPGPFARTAVCSFNAAGRAYAAANGWTSARSAGNCATCETWTVPLAQAKLSGVSDVTARDRTHARATYTYEVHPNEIGAQLAAWMTENPIAWCGSDPRQVGEWSHVQVGKADFVLAKAGWQFDPSGSTPLFESAAGHPPRPCLPT